MASLESIIPNREKRSILTALVRGLKALPFVLAVVLFGSYARGEATPISDVDLCVLDDTRFPEEERMRALDSASNTVNISVFSKLPLYVKFDVLSQGIVLWSRNENRLLELREQVFLEYMDTRYLWQEPGAIERWLADRK